MSEAGTEAKVTVILDPAEMKALMRLGLRLSGGYGWTKTKLCREAVRCFILAHEEPILYKKASRKRVPKS